MEVFADSVVVDFAGSVAGFSAGLACYRLADYFPVVDCQLAPAVFVVADVVLFRHGYHVADAALFAGDDVSYPLSPMNASLSVLLRLQIPVLLLLAYCW